MRLHKESDALCVCISLRVEIFKRRMALGESHGAARWTNMSSTGMMQKEGIILFTKYILRLCRRIIGAQVVLDVPIRFLFCADRHQMPNHYFRFNMCNAYPMFSEFINNNLKGFLISQRESSVQVL